MPLDILEEIGQTYGPTRKLHQVLATLVAATVENLEKSRAGPEISGLSFETLSPQMDLQVAMQVPMRIDSSLHLGSINIPGPSPAAGQCRHQPSDLSNAPLNWQGTNGALGADGSTPVHLDTQRGESVASTVDAAQSSLENTFEQSMLWAPSLDWTGGWDDFLNAIAMQDG